MRVPKQVVEARRSRLTELLRERGYVPISELCEELGVSEATARRDLSALEGEERITRTYGGALGEFNANFTSFRERLREGADAKGSIARAAASLIRPGMCVYLDAGTTAFAIAQELRRHLPEQLTVITNNLALLETLGSLPGAKTILLGGQLLERQSVLLGNEAVKAAALQQIDIAFLSAQGMNEQGLWNSQRDIIRLQQAVMKRAGRSCFCLDRTKLGHTAPEHLASWPKIHTLVSDLSLPELRQAGIALKPGVLLHSQP
ncbi:MAG: DeoR/GlpR family DNA-binding transcription regulator [Chthoniobacterales bacterium]